MVKQVTDYFIYRWRYVVGYAIVGLTMAELLLIAALYVPGGLSPLEMSSAVMSTSLKLGEFNPGSIVNLPYYLLQSASLHVFGITDLSIKLPSLVFGFLSIIGMIILLRTWFRENVAILTTVLIVTTGQFLFVAQSGTPSILYIFWSVWILVAASMLSRKANWSAVWKIVLFGLISLSLYTPLSLYVIVALAGAVVFHPHLRYIVRRLSLKQVAVAAFCALLLIAPLIQSIVMQPRIGLQLLGIPSSMPNVSENAGLLLRQYIDFASPSSTFMMTPIYSLPAMLLILIGIYRLITTKYTARSYIISIWIVLLIPILLINPMFVSVTFVPVMLLMAMGVTILFSRWYRLFPLNPYARIAGLVPIAVLMVSMVFSGFDRYAYGYHYDPQTAGNFSRDLKLVNRLIAAHPDDSTTIVTSPDEFDFYSAVASQYPEMKVKALSPTLPSTSIVIVTRAAKQNTSYGAPIRITTNGQSQNSDRFYVYNSTAK